MSTTESDERVETVVLDVLPNGRPGDDRPPSQKDPLAYALGVEEFGLYELTLSDDAHVLVGRRLVVEPRDDRDEQIVTVQDASYTEVSGAAQSELKYAIEELIEADERRFVDFYNEAQPITLRLHQLNLLPGIGKKLRNDILDERKREPFDAFEDIAERVSGLHHPKDVLVERITEELREDDLKYRIFARAESEA
ncbi:DUF655 domain-containing protein [Halobacteriales archaeon QS_9_67_17]|nr:MAG: DUF655 domain-containing protein [Halobacteriales archaeon QS_9_67_17]